MSTDLAKYEDKLLQYSYALYKHTNPISSYVYVKGYFVTRMENID